MLLLFLNIYRVDEGVARETKTCISDWIQRLRGECLVRPKNRGQSCPFDMFCLQQKKGKTEERKRAREGKKEQITAASSISHYIEYSV